MSARSSVIIILNVLISLLLAGTSHAAPVGPIEIQSVQIVPPETAVGRQPEITGSIKATKMLPRGETLVITVIAVVVWPDHVLKSWTWKDVRMQTGDIRSFSIPKSYEIRSAGTYKVDFNVYSKDMMPLQRLSKTFLVKPSIPSPDIITPVAPVDSGLRTEASSGRAVVSTAEYRSFGVGLQANMPNNSGGTTMLLWPFKHVGLQASYSVGSFSIAEGRILACFPLSSGIRPYMGVGYLDVVTEREVEIINVRTKFHGSGASGVLGVEVPLGRRIFGSVELSGASIDLKKEMTSGGVTGTASVKFPPVTIGINMVYFLF